MRLVCLATSLQCESDADLEVNVGAEVIVTPEMDEAAQLDVGKYIVVDDPAGIMVIKVNGQLQACSAPEPRELTDAWIVGRIAEVVQNVTANDVPSPREVAAAVNRTRVPRLQDDVVDMVSFDEHVISARRDCIVPSVVYFVVANLVADAECKDGWYGRKLSALKPAYLRIENTMARGH